MTTTQKETGDAAASPAQVPLPDLTNDSKVSKDSSMKKVKVTVAEMMASIGSRNPGVFIQEYQHDGWCKTLQTGNGHDCNCSPDVVIYRLEEEGGK